MTVDTEEVKQIQVTWKEYAALASGVKSFVIVPLSLGCHEGDTLIVSPVCGVILRARVGYVISAESPCALSPEALNPDYATLSIEVIL